MNKVQEFLNEQFGEVRVVEINKEIWFMASDVARVLQYPIATNMTRNLDDDEKDIQSLNTPGGEQECLIINESGLYNAVLSITKRNPERYHIARNFKKWITGTVIPAIRKDDGYVDGEEDFAKGELSEAEFILKAMNMLHDKVERLEKENEEMKPKVNKWEKFLNSDGTYSFTQVSKLLSTMAQEEKSDINISVVKLTEFLRQQDVLSKQKSPDKIKNGKVKKGTYKNLPNKEYEDYFNVASVSVTDKFSTTQTTVKSSGVELIYNLVKEKYSA